MSRNLFTYGTLMCEDIFRSVAGCDSGHAPAVLGGYRRFRVVGEVYPGIVGDFGSKVDGIVYYDIGDDAFRRLDAFEGEQYERADVSILTGTERIGAATYVFRPQFLDRLSSDDWTFDEFLANKNRFLSGYPGFSCV